MPTIGCYLAPPVRLITSYADSGVTLVEIFPGENDDDFRAAMDAILQAVAPGEPRWWHPYEVRGTYEHGGIRFRDFYCIAGSVQLWVWLHARAGGTRRVILVPDESVLELGGVKMIGGGREVSLPAQEVVALGGRPHNQPMQRTEAAGIVSVIPKLLGRGPGR
jgi:hypothetical protein